MDLAGREPGTASNLAALKRRLRASKAGSASWTCTCGSRDGTHTPDCRRERRKLDAQRGGLKTLERHGAAHFRRLRWHQLLGTRDA
jgi:hypothetical protein